MLRAAHLSRRLSTKPSGASPPRGARHGAGLTRAGTDWEALINKAASPTAKQELARLAGVYARVGAEAQAANVAPAAVDFAAYRKKLSNPKKVDAFENALKSLKYPESQLTTVQQQQAKLEELMNAAKTAAESSAVRAKELETLIARLSAGKTTKDTTVDEVAALYPEIEREVQTEAKEEQWGKGIGL